MRELRGLIAIMTIREARRDFGCCDRCFRLPVASSGAWGEPLCSEHAAIYDAGVMKHAPPGGYANPPLCEPFRRQPPPGVVELYDQALAFLATFQSKP